jgi:hypothetical protein
MTSGEDVIASPFATPFTVETDVLSGSQPCQLSTARCSFSPLAPRSPGQLRRAAIGTGDTNRLDLDSETRRHGEGSEDEGRKVPPVWVQIVITDATSRVAPELTLQLEVTACGSLLASFVKMSRRLSCQCHIVPIARLEGVIQPLSKPACTAHPILYHGTYIIGQVRMTHG